MQSKATRSTTTTGGTSRAGAKRTKMPDASKESERKEGTKGSPPKGRTTKAPGAGRTKSKAVTTRKVVSKGGARKKASVKEGAAKERSAKEASKREASQQKVRLLAEVRERLQNNQEVRRTLVRGRLRIDRQLPFLIVYRRPKDKEVTGTERLVTAEAAYMIAPGDPRAKVDLHELALTIVESLSEEFGAFLLLELWPATHPERTAEPGEDEEIPPPPHFTVVTSKKESPQRTIERMRNALGVIRLEGQWARVDVDRRDKVAPPGMAPLLSDAEARRLNCYTLGLEVDPIYHNKENGEVYPVLLLKLRRMLGSALKKTWHEFTRTQTDRSPPHYHSLGPHAVTKAVWDVDTRLATISESFDLLLAVTPTNPESAWEEFVRARYDKAPEFYYRPLDVDPELLKRGLFNIPIERVEDPSLAHLLREKQEEMDRQITMLKDRGTRRFMYESIQLYGIPGSPIVKAARELLAQLPGTDRGEPAGGGVSAQEFAKQVQKEYAYYRAIHPDFSSKVIIREDINQGLMVSQGKLLIGEGTAIPKRRIDALIQHEVGTHVLTFSNGKAQPLKQLYCGLAGYEEFQEGIAVLAEYLVGGLTHSRIRTLAARVVGVDMMLHGASFVETFHHLTHDHGFTRRAAFTIVMRIYRGGGLTKDAVYLRGLQRVLEYLRDGGDVRSLFIGKIAAHHVPIIRELQFRNVLREAPLIPRYMQEPKARERLNRLYKGMDVIDLIERRRSRG